ncbi:hypothetical protein EMIHUDRAFT_220389 [Emiliania huxleyi CCMP1516]|uniref:Uncharacterized protein n=2 Tax=Emiliania huxleyi TaxID=2903 RepID=A0A0D3I121_EMIH1|nr:hypothetical protein EMIHUDRAFT_220389 [Emiliania huxleyi CCMP1516]EOD04956.1 hypothetical protein EMIHUDRAFT_220389 [Emiliania huxleyi CCMP1516]|eukprot:XP_005757385.1 hypothetical protein EMIHUDRAFT_220389 [Emiliania huxleyi CCMP1516]
MTTLVRAEKPSEPAEVVLDASAAGFNATSVEFALLFSELASVRDLCDSLAGVLHQYGTVGGRMVKRGTSTVVLCNNAGVPLTHESRQGPPPSLAHPVDEEYFDLVRDWVPTAEVAADAPTRIKVTDFDQGQLIAISVSHGIVDARSLGVFLRAWSAAYRGDTTDEPVSFDASVLPAAPAGFGAAPVVASDGIPDAWRAHHRPFKMPHGTAFAPAVTTYHRSRTALAALAARFDPEGGSPLSANDALCGEVAEAVGATSVALMVDYRQAVGAGDLFGVAISTQDVVAEAPSGVPAALRRAVPLWRARDFVDWKIGQGSGGCAEVFFNSWVRAFALPETRFAAPVQTIMLGRSMCAARMRAFAPMGVPYVLMLPHNDGVTVVVMGPEDVGGRIEGASSVALPSE